LNSTYHLDTKRLLLLPLDRSDIIELLKGSRSKLKGYDLHPEWPDEGLMDALPVAANDLLDDSESLIWHPWVMVKKEKWTIVGDAGFKGAPDPEGVVRIGYSVVPSERRKGFAREALIALLSLASRIEDVVRVQAQVSPGNTASVRVLRGLGFEHTGRSGDVLIFEKLSVSGQNGGGQGEDRLPAKTERLHRDGWIYMGH